MIVSCRPPGIRKLCPGFAVVSRPPRVVEIGGATAITAHEDDAPVRQHDAAVLVSCRPLGAVVHQCPGCAAVGRPPRVVQSVVPHTAHEDDAPVRQHDAAVIVSCRPPGTRVHQCPGCAVVGRPPRVVQSAAVVHTAHEDDVPVRQRDTGVAESCRPPGSNPGRGSLVRPGCAVVGRPPRVVQ